MQKALLSILISSLCLFGAEQSLQVVNNVLSKIAQKKEEVLRQREEILRNPPEDIEERLREINEVLRRIDAIEASVLSYKRRLLEASEVSGVEVQIPERPLSDTVKELLGIPEDNDLNPDVLISSEGKAVLSFKGKGGAVYVVGRLEEEGFTPEWAVLLAGAYILVSKDNTECSYTRNAHATLSKCPEVIEIIDSDALGLPSGKLQLKVKAGELAGKIDIPAVVEPAETPSIILHVGEYSFPLYRDPKTTFGKLLSEIPEEINSFVRENTGRLRE